MKTGRIFCAVIITFIATKVSYGQDPAFSQFFSSPLNINPALTGNINADWRVISNFRDQWIGPSSPYVTGTVSYDRKFFQNEVPMSSSKTDEGNVLGLGGMLMFDRAMGGIVKSSYASLNLSYNVKLFDGPFKHRLGVGFGATYGRRKIDFSSLYFEEQFTGQGFNTSLPTGETSLSGMKGYISASAGVTYSISSENINFDIGASAYHINKPRQTFLLDEKQVIPIRKVVHANFEAFLNNQLILNSNAILQEQASTSYLSFGSALGYFLPSETDILLSAGVWYWSKNAIVPYIGLSFKDYQFGLSYDVTTSKLSQTTLNHSTFELSLIVRGRKRPTGVIPCPWK